jgi:hypothetical protein
VYQGSGIGDRNSGLAPNDHKPGVIPLFLVIAGNDEEFAPLEGLQGVLEGLHELDLLGIVDAMEPNLQVTVTGGF